MAGRGPASKGTRSRGRDQKRIDAEVVIVQADGLAHGPDLPDEIQWPDVTRSWWETWRKSAQAKTFTDTDWSFLLDTAVLHMEFWDGDRSVAGELRLRAAKFGATPEDRARLKISVGDPKPSGEATQTPAARTKQKARRTRILEVVADADSA